MIKTVLFAAIGGFLFGYDTSIIAGAQLYFEDEFPDITVAWIATIVSVAMVGAAFGALLGGTISDRVGRKPVIMIADVFFTIGALALAFAPWL